MTTSTTPTRTETTDVVVVGARIAGNAAAISFAKAGRKVIALDRASFPSDTLSTHFLFATGITELSKLGALDRVLATGAPKYRFLNIVGEQTDGTGPMAPKDGFDYGMAPRRTVLDKALVDTAREAGVDLRERCDVRSLVWQGGRAAGVRYTDAEGVEHEIRARLVVGADGRRSAVAGWVGSGSPYRTRENGRGLAFRYVTDGRPDEQRDTIHRWHVGDTIGFHFPTNGPESLALFMGPKERIHAFRRDPERMWAEHVEANPYMKRMLEGTEPTSKLRSAADTFSYFRVSTGPGWVLVGDAGHFKDPVIAQGIRDGLRYGRLAAEAAAPHLDDEERLDAALRHYEIDRDRACVPAFWLGLQESRVHPLNAVEREFYAEVASEAPAMVAFMNVLCRVEDPRTFFTPRRLATYAARALRRSGDTPREVLRDVRGELRIWLSLRRDLALLATGRRVEAGDWDRWTRRGWSAELSLPGYGAPKGPARRAEPRKPPARTSRPATAEKVAA